MIPITPEIIGPGIEEEYDDALAAIADMRVALGAHPLTNHTPEGRVMMEIKWLEQEIDARRLPIPVDRSYVGTVFYMVGSNELGHYQRFSNAIGRLYLALGGDGLIKARHVPLLISMIDDVIYDCRKVTIALSDEDTGLISDLSSDRETLQRGSWPETRPPQRMYSTLITKSLDSAIGRGRNRLRAIDFPLFDGWRPYPARKPPMSAPVPGLPERAPSLPPELKGKLP